MLNKIIRYTSIAMLLTTIISLFIVGIGVESNAINLEKAWGYVVLLGICGTLSLTLLKLGGEGNKNLYDL